MRISAGSSAVCSSDLVALQGFGRLGDDAVVIGDDVPQRTVAVGRLGDVDQRLSALHDVARGAAAGCLAHRRIGELEPRRPGETLRADRGSHARSEEHTSELQSLMRISYAVFCLKKNKTKT